MRRAVLLMARHYYMMGDLHRDAVVVYSRLISPSEFFVLASRLLAWVLLSTSGGNVWMVLLEVSFQRTMSSSNMGE